VIFPKLLEKVPKVKEVKKQGGVYRIKVEDGEETAPIILEAIRTEGHTVTRLSLTKPTLDEVYLEYTGRSIREAEEPKARASSSDRHFPISQLK
jgi:ABC-2 type transport system ATP-binding protein